MTTSSTYTATLRDPSLPHQIDFHYSTQLPRNGLQIVVGCNCQWRSRRSIQNLEDAWRLYDEHLEG